MFVSFYVFFYYFVHFGHYKICVHGELLHEDYASQKLVQVLNDTRVINDHFYTIKQKYQRLLK